MWLPISRLMVVAATAMSTVTPGDSLITTPVATARYDRRVIAKSANAARVMRLRHTLEQGLDQLDADLAVLELPSVTGRSATGRSAQQAFRRARLDYKRIEGSVEFYGPLLVMAVNGPGTQEDDDNPTDGRLVPKGFPLVEPMLFPAVNRHQLHDVGVAAVTMRRAVKEFRAVTGFVTITNVQLFEIARTEIARVSTLSIAGFDATESGDGIVESAAALDGVRQLLMVDDQPRDQAPEEALQRATGYLRAHPRFDSFDRFTFITQYANPAAHLLGVAQRGLPDPRLILRRAWVLDAGSVFDAGAIDAQAYAPAEAPRPTPALVSLGRTLFFDPVLSGNDARACASCHKPERAFADGLPRARQFGPGSPPTRHTPSLINAAYQPAQFDDERAASLEQQIGLVLASPAEMHSSIAKAVSNVRQSAEYRQDFAQVYKVSPDTAVTAYRLQTALATYVRSLTAMNSRFDRSMRGEPALLHPNERRGFNLFMGKAQCGTCHFAPLFNGVAPPTYMSDEVEVIGVPTKVVSRHAIIDPDSGRAAIDHLVGHLHAFKPPTVRNASLAGAYMHNGAYRTLDEVMNFYNHGGGSGLGAQVPNATLSTDPLHLSSQEQRDVIAFLKTLVDTAGLTARPNRLPRFEHSERLNDRPIGGLY